MPNPSSTPNTLNSREREESEWSESESNMFGSDDESVFGEPVRSSKPTFNDQLSATLGFFYFFFFFLHFCFIYLIPLYTLV